MLEKLLWLIVGLTKAIYSLTYGFVINSIKCFWIELGKLRRWVKVFPIRPDSDEQSAAEVTWIRYPGGNLPVGVVHRVPDGRLFYSPIEEGTGRLCVEETRYLPNPKSELTAGQHFCSPTFLGSKGGPANNEVKKFLIKSYYGKKAAAVLDQLSLA